MKKSINIAYKILPHILFVILITIQFTEGYFVHKGFVPFVIGMSILEILCILRHNKSGNSGVFAILFGFLTIWHLYANNFAEQKSGLLPPPSYIANVIYEDRTLILNGMVSSSARLGGAFLTALVLGIVIGLLCGKIKRLQTSLMPVSEAIASVPALVYAPYTVAVFGDFQKSAFFIITVGLFFPIMLNTINTVNTFPKVLSDNAKMLNVSFCTYIFRVLLPYSLPSLFNTVSSQIANAFILLIGAEMLGMTVGAGWYVKYYSDMMNYQRVIAGFVVIALLVAVCNMGLDFIRKKIIKWEVM
ncbi:MAG: ABC transporter permease subunit [Oscillospiraceae bacterium]|jgi:NitT/TauT family transport system permease protein|nr:ABC transporter permease subunit [Oscillospiraceae bacterium]